LEEKLIISLIENVEDCSRLCANFTCVNN